MLPATARAVFISYAHADNASRNPKERWLDRFVEFLKPLVRQSDYIANSELPVILKNTAERGVKIFPLLISPSAFKRAKYKYPGS
jgi:hypothetical protein